MIDKGLWGKALMSGSSSIQEAILNLEQSSLRIILVVSHDLRLLGTISDGDIRRALLKSISLESQIDKIMHREALVVPPQLDLDNVRQLMLANKIQQIPIVDKERRVVGLHVWDELQSPQQRNNLMVIMAGGRGMRLRPHTEYCPKPLLRVAGKPILEHIIERSKKSGFVRFVISIHYLGEMIEEYFGDGQRWDIEISYLKENSPLGTAGALSLLSPKPDAAFIVTNGDVLTDINYADLLDFHVRHESSATMAVRLHEWQHPYGVVQIQGIDIIGFEEKPIARTYINAGVYAFEPHALECIPDGRFDMPALFERIQIKSHRTIAYPMHEPWLDVGKPEDLNLARDQKEHQ